MRCLRLTPAAMVGDCAYLSIRCLVACVILIAISVEGSFAQDSEERERGERGGDSVVRRLEGELQKAIRDNNQAEVEEIRALLLKLGRSDAQGRSRTESLQVPFLVNCGGGGGGGEESEAEAEGIDAGRERSQVRRPAIRRLPDQAFNERASYGFTGGQSRQSWLSAVWGTEE